MPAVAAQYIWLIEDTCTWDEDFLKGASNLVCSWRSGMQWPAGYCSTFLLACAGQVLKEFDESDHIRTVTIDLGTINRKFTYFTCHRSPTGQKGPDALCSYGLLYSLPTG